MMNFLLSYICLKLEFSPLSVYDVAIVVALACFILRLIFLRRMVNKFSMLVYLRKVSLNVLKVVVIASFIPVIVSLIMKDGWSRMFILIPLSLLCAIISIYNWGCSSSERVFISEKLSLVCKKLRL